DGFFAYRGLDGYWGDPGRAAFLLRRGSSLAGFALVNAWSASGAPTDHAVAEFFVLRKHRRVGFGAEAAEALIGSRPGRWEVAVADYNEPAKAFWPKALAPFAPVERVEGDGDRWRGPIFRLTAGSAEARAQF
ncbi:MAG: GNAT family N-acetyltransferase, partial [Pseudomonadota bacterium]